MQNHCQACGMPLINQEDYACGDKNAKFCVYCTNADGSPKSCAEIFEGGVQFFMTTLGQDRNLAEKITRKNMRALPYWKNNTCTCLQGEVATDAEFAEVLKKLS